MNKQVYRILEICNLHDIYNQRRNLVSLSSSAAVFFTFTKLSYSMNAMTFTRRRLRTDIAFE